MATTESLTQTAASLAPSVNVDQIIAQTVFFGIGFLILLVIVGIGVFVGIKLLFKHQLIIEELNYAGSVGQTKIVKCREFVDDGIRYWRTWGLLFFDVYPAPPESAISFSGKNKKVSRGFLQGDTIAYIYPDVKSKYYYKEISNEIVSNSITSEVGNGDELDNIESTIVEKHGPEALKALGVKIGTKNYIRKAGFFHKFELFTNSQKFGYISRLKAAQKRRNQFWEKTMPIINVGALLVIVIIGIIIMYQWHDKPLQMADKANQMGSKVIQMQDSMEDFYKFVYRNETAQPEPTQVEGVDIILR